jgi:5-methylcytosine-specific restriction endonuclease McrA
MNNFMRARRKQIKARQGAARFGHKARLKGKPARRKIARSMLPPARLPSLPPDAASMDPTTRITRLGWAAVFPKRPDKTCRCGCGAAVETRQWASDDCEKGALFAYWYWKGDPTAIEWGLWRRDGGVCFRCHEQVPGGRKGPWHGHHVVAVAKGGARLGLSNFISVCIPCHKAIHAARNEVAPSDKII